MSYLDDPETMPEDPKYVVGFDPGTNTGYALLKPVREPRRTGLQSSDPVLSTCVHEIARALEEFARKQHVPIMGTEAEFETAAIEIAEKLSVEKCPLRGV